MIIRIETDRGVKRLSIEGSQTYAQLYLRVTQEFEIGGGDWKLYFDRGKASFLPSTEEKCHSLKNGQLLFLYPTEGLRLSSVAEDPIDVALWNSDPRIYMGNSQLCHHPPNGRCINCNFVEPYDADYLAKCCPQIKFLPFHSHMRKLMHQSKGGPVTLEVPKCRVDQNCSFHKPYPAGICSRCQPGAITLNRQSFRNVEFVSFENDTMVQRFLEFWRKTGRQRVGFLFGRYEPMRDVPLGIMAVVVAIYEPPQRCERDEVQLGEDREERRVRWMAGQLGLVPIGWIFTDLVAGEGGAVKHFRGNKDSYFLSSQECLVSAHLQNLHPNPCRLAPGGFYGSKFVTVVATGDSTNQIHLEAYQTSVQTMELVKHGLLQPTIGCSQLSYISMSSDDRYVPDVFYVSTDQYGNTVNNIARPLPNELLITDLGVGTPKLNAYSLPVDTSKKFFPIENRSDYLENQSLLSFAKYWQQFDSFMDCIGDFHVLLFLTSAEFSSLEGCFSDLLRAVRDHDLPLLSTLQHSIDMQSLIELVGAALESAPPDGRKSCSRCTFINIDANTRCEVCGFQLD